MKEFGRFLKDKSILSALLIICILEICMQFGCYKVFQKKSSYAWSVNHITDNAINSLPKLRPNTLLLGTSIAYEGLSSEILNEKLAKYGYVIQSIAIPGAELIVQELALRKILEEPNEIKYIIHVNELPLPWVDRMELLDATLSMISEFNRFDSIRKLHEDRYEVRVADYLYMLFKWVSYRRDIADFILSPDKRIKDIGKELNKNKDSFYSYRNEYLPSMTLYNFKTLEECIKKSSPVSIIPIHSDKYHKDALFRTCNLVKDTKLPIEKNNLTYIYKIRLKNLYDFIRSKNIKIVNIYPPVPEYLEIEDYKKRIYFWNTEYSDTLSENIYDLSDAIPHENNSDYYYDMIHLNKKGMEIFTEKLINTLLQNKNNLE